MPELRKLTECHQFEESLNAAVLGTSYDTMCKTTPYTAGTIQRQSVRNCWNSGCCQTCQRIATETQRNDQQPRWRSTWMHSVTLRSLHALSLQSGPMVQKGCLVFFTWLKDRLLGSCRTLGKAGVECRSLQTSPDSVCEDNWEFSAEGWETESVQDAGQSMWYSCLI